MERCTLIPNLFEKNTLFYNNMRLKKLTVKNFRGYKGETSVTFDSMTALIGKNDIGKSTILDALGVFFQHPLLKNVGIDDYCKFATDDEMYISCMFDELPQAVVIDETAQTTLEEEYLLNEDKMLEIKKCYKVSNGKLSPPKYFIRALHPEEEAETSLLSFKIADLKRKMKELNCFAPENASIKKELRKVIRETYSEGNLVACDVALDKEDGKSIWEQLQPLMPTFALFRSDRASSDEDMEAQDPLKVAVSMVMEEQQAILEELKTEVRKKALDVAQRTIEKLKDFDMALASQLKPEFKAEPKWDSIFKLSIKGDDDIPMNKRGSGVRRLILISFFRAEVERLMREKGGNNVIYAIEEPETAQHGDFQAKIINTFMEMSENDLCQIIFTTHVPGLVSAIPTDSVRYIHRNANQELLIDNGMRGENDSLLMEIANELGVIPDLELKAMMCVEGDHDVNFLRAMNQLMIAEGEDIVDIVKDPHVTLQPLGGGTLRQWVNEHYMRKFGLKEVHVYDSDKDSDTDSPHYIDAMNEVNRRTDGSRAFATNKRELENYYHPKIINEAVKSKYGMESSFAFGDYDNVEKRFVEYFNNLPWRNGKVPNMKAKVFLNKHCASSMTAELLKENGGYDEILGWFKVLTNMVR